MKQRGDAVLARERAGVLRDDATSRQLVYALERGDVLADVCRPFVDVVERRPRNYKHLRDVLSRHRGGAPIAPHEGKLADAAPALDVPDERALAALVAPDRQPSQGDKIERVGLVALAEQDLPRGERPTQRRHRGEPQPACQRRQCAQAASHLLGAERDEPLAERVVARQRGLEVRLRYAREARRLGRAGAGGAAADRARQQ